jgi:hypothetical protein
VSFSTIEKRGGELMPVTALAQMTEQELLDNVIELGHLLGYRIAHFRAAQTAHGWRTPVSADGKGFPDLVLVRERGLFVELKSSKGRLSDDQLDWAAALVNGSAEVHCWRPADWTNGEIESVLRRRAISSPCLATPTTERTKQ